MKNIQDYSSIIEVVETFSDENKNLRYLEEIRWRDGIKCPHCESDNICRFSDGNRLKCRTCRRQFNAKTGTIYEGTKLPLQKWFIAQYLELVSNKGISSYELARQIKVTQNTAWLMLTNIRANFAIANKKEEKPFEGVVEVDETWVGGKNKNRHKNKKKTYVKDSDITDKALVLGLLERGGKVKAMVIPDRTNATLRPIIMGSVKSGSPLMTDDHVGYNGMEYWYAHKRVKHQAKVYVVEDSHTNGIENFWSIFKRGIIGVYHNVSKKHLDKYVQEFVFRYNTRNLTSKGRIELLIAHSDSRIKRKDLKRAA